jgi:hypothetical protein
MFAHSIKHATKLAAIAIALCFSGAASATIDNLSGQYSLQASYTPVTGQSNEFTFNYSVTNLGQGYSNSQTGLDGFTIYIPTSATVLSATAPQPYVGSPGFWSKGASPALDLALGGTNTTQNMVAPAGYQAYTFWGQYTESVYQLGSTANFSITLGNVSVGSNTVGISSYYGFSAPPVGQQYVTNQYGNYTTFTANAVSAIGVVPEPASYAMLLAGLGAIGLIARRRRQA